MRSITESIYFDWLVDLVAKDLFSKDTSYRKLLEHLYSIDFKYVLRMDKNRAEDGLGLRRKFSLATGYNFENRMKRCSVLEMMIALAVRCEDSIMEDPEYGNRVPQWFWGMIKNLGLYNMTDYNFDEEIVDNVIQKFLNREYEPDGRGGLFRINNCRQDVRKVEIWCQLCWYLNQFV